MREHLNTEENRQLLADAVQAKSAYWDAMRALELALGLFDVPDLLNNWMHEKVENLAIDGLDAADAGPYLQDILDHHIWADEE